MNTGMKKMFSIMLFFAASTFMASAQFSFVGSKLQLRISDTHHNPINDASVWINGFKMTPVKTGSGSGYQSYEIDTARLGGNRSQLEQRKFKITVVHPGYQYINDSMYMAPGFFYLGNKGDGYVYQYNKRPFVLHPNHYFVQSYTDSSTFRKAMDSLGVTIIESYQYCKGFKKQYDSGPLIFIVHVPKEKESGFFAYRLCQPALLLTTQKELKKSHTITGASVRISFMVKSHITHDSIKAYLESLPEIEYLNHSYYVPQHYTISIRKEALPQVISFTEKLIGSGLIEMPVNELLMFDCPTD
jgi:hypothetical protein